MGRASFAFWAKTSQQNRGRPANTPPSMDFDALYKAQQEDYYNAIPGTMGISRWLNAGVPEAVAAGNLAVEKERSKNAPNRTPSPGHLAHLNRMYGGGFGGGGAVGGGGNPAIPTPGIAGAVVPREAFDGAPGFGSKPFGPDSPEEDERDGIFGAPLRTNAPPRRPGGSNLANFLRSRL